MTHPPLLPRRSLLAVVLDHEAGPALAGFLDASARAGAWVAARGLLTLPR